MPLPFPSSPSVPCLFCGGPTDGPDAFHPSDGGAFCGLGCLLYFRAKPKAARIARAARKAGKWRGARADARLTVKATGLPTLKAVLLLPRAAWEESAAKKAPRTKRAAK